MGDSRWETVVSQGQKLNKKISDNLIKCPCCGRKWSYKSEKCKKCGYNFKTHTKPKNYVKPIFLRQGFIECPNCGWKQPDKNKRCSFCDYYFITE